MEDSLEFMKKHVHEALKTAKPDEAPDSFKDRWTYGIGAPFDSAPVDAEPKVDPKVKEKTSQNAS